MSLLRPSEQRLLAVRLDRIHPEVRLRAARQIARAVPEDGPSCLFAALYPSSRVYFVRGGAAEILERIAA